MILLTGLSYRTAPVAVRERLAFPDGEIEEATRRAAKIGAGEAMILSTCNRVEIYVAGDPRAGDDARRAIEELIVETRRIERATFSPMLYSHAGEPALMHLFRVTASLDSMVIGEPQILGQVKEAYQIAERAGTVGSILGRAVPRAFATAKRVRTETEMARSSASVASVAVDLAQHIFGSLSGRDVLVVGAGEMGTHAARHLASAGAGGLLVVNRTEQRGIELAAQIGGQAHPWSELPSLLTRADIVVCSTGASEPVIRRDLVHRAMRARKGRWLCLIDIAVPRAVDESVGDEENVYLYDVDSLSRMVDDNMAGRRKEAEQAERIVAEEVARLLSVERSLGVVPTIKALRERFAEVARGEVERTLGRLDGASDRHRREVQALADSIVNKLLHAPLTSLKRDGDPDALADAVRVLFQLDEAAASAARKSEESGDKTASGSGENAGGQR